jgi:hypothetical protein
VTPVEADWQHRRCAQLCNMPDVEHSVHISRRLRESGAPDHEVAAWLGHANISTTSVHFKTNRLTLQHAAKRFEQKRKLCRAIVRTIAQQARNAALATSRNPDKLLN